VESGVRHTTQNMRKEDQQKRPREPATTPDIKPAKPAARQNTPNPQHKTHNITKRDSKQTHQTTKQTTKTSQRAVSMVVLLSLTLILPYTTHRTSATLQRMHVNPSRGDRNRVNTQHLKRTSQLSTTIMKINQKKTATSQGTKKERNKNSHTERTSGHPCPMQQDDNKQILPSIEEIERMAMEKNGRGPKPKRTERQTNSKRTGNTDNASVVL